MLYEYGLDPHWGVQWHSLGTARAQGGAIGGDSDGDAPVCGKAAKTASQAKKRKAAKTPQPARHKKQPPPVRARAPAWCGRGRGRGADALVQPAPEWGAATVFAQPPAAASGGTASHPPAAAAAAIPAAVAAFLATPAGAGVIAALLAAQGGAPALPALLAALAPPALPDPAAALLARPWGGSAPALAPAQPPTGVVVSRVAEAGRATAVPTAAASEKPTFPVDGLHVPLSTQHVLGDILRAGHQQVAPQAQVRVVHRVRQQLR